MRQKLNFLLYYPGFNEEKKDNCVKEGQDKPGEKRVGGCAVAQSGRKIKQQGPTATAEPRSREMGVK